MIRIGEAAGIAAEFADEADLIGAASRLRDTGFTRIEAYTPYPVAGLDAVLPRPMRALPVLVFAGGCLGIALGFGLQWYGAVIGYPINVGGRPLASWPAFIPIAFEIAVLSAVSSGFVGFFALAGLPQPYQPIAALPGFERATQDRFFLIVDHRDPQFDPARIGAVIAEFAPCSVAHWQP